MTMIDKVDAPATATKVEGPTVFGLFGTVFGAWIAGATPGEAHAQRGNR